MREMLAKTLALLTAVMIIFLAAAFAFVQNG
jgi:hypothetical protein